MPTIEVTIQQLPPAIKRSLCARLTEVFTTPDVPADWVTVIFRHIGAEDYARGGRFPYWPGAAAAEDDPLQANIPLQGPAIVDVTIGQLDEGEKRRIAAAVSDALTAMGITESDISIHFRHVTGRDVAEGGGRFPFRPPGSKW